MDQTMFNAQLNELDVSIVNQEAFFTYICEKLLRLGYVKEGYRESLMIRERKYPTGLPTSPHPVCIPHSSPDFVLKPFITFTRLANAIAWSEMGNSENVLESKLIMVLGFDSSTNHIDLLQKIIEGVQTEAFVKTLFEEKDTHIILRELRELEGKGDKG